ncbi:MAG TPA: BTAD domain-containing putative transcriptional regulator [Thermoleophilaceae bacterium]|jgi:DNA-binding SARP family transcriptional activator/tetratricopeptide (TPR) repeat protein
MDFCILGPLEVHDGNNRVPLGGAKQRALLGFLLLHANEVVSSDRLVDELWGEAGLGEGSKALQVAVSRLRKVIGPNTLVTRPPGYELRIQDGQLDLQLFEALFAKGRAADDRGAASYAFQQALALWRGPPLGDLAFESFAQAEIARLEELRLTALEDRIAADLDLGRHVELIGELQALVAEYPLRESLRGQLMLALYRSGRHAEALDIYRDARRALVDKLGIEPGAKLRELEQAVLTQDASLAWTAPTERRTPDGGRARRALLGREPELGELLHALDDAIQGRGTVFLIAGEPGIGKSRLAEELVQEAAERGARVLVGRCWEAGGAPAYWPWVQVLRSLLQEREPGSVESPAPGPGAAALAQLVPELRQTSPDAPALASAGARFQLFEEIARLLRESAAAEPLVVVLDDLQAADTPSLLLLQFLAGQLARSRFLIAALHRDDDLRDDRSFATCVADIAREPTTRRLRLAGLSAADTSRLIESIVGHPVSEAAARRIYAETDGNPLFVGEIARLLSAEGSLEPKGDLPSGPQPLPDTVTDVIGQRLDRLASACRSLLRGASILGREFRVRELAAVSDMDESAALETLDDAITARVLTVSAVDRVRFSHALVRETLYGSLTAVQRRESHRRAGETLESLYASDLEPHLAELAHHFYEALPGGEPAKAVDYARRAGDRAGQLLAYEEAVRLYRLALAALDVQSSGADDQRCALLVALGDAAARAGDETGARGTFLEAAEVARRAGLPLELARAALGYGGRFVWARAYGDAHLIPLLEEALVSLPGDASDLRAKLMARLAGALRDHPSRERRASLSAQAVEIARRQEDSATLAYVLDGRYGALMWPDNPEERLGIADEIVALAEQASDDERAIGGRIYRVIACMELGRMLDVERELEVTAERAAELRQPAQLWFTAAMRAVVALLRGKFDEAEPLIDTALSLGERAQRRDAVLSHRLQLFILRRETGGLVEIEELMERTVSEFPTRPVFRCALSCLRADLERPGPARRQLHELASHDFASIQRDNEFLFSLGFLADAAHQLEDVRSASVLYDLLVPFAHLNASNADELATGSVSRPLGVLAATLMRWDDATGHFEAALVQNTAMGARPWIAHTRHDYGNMLLARAEDDDRERGIALLASAREDYEELGMTPWATKVQNVVAAIPS